MSPPRPAGAPQMPGKRVAYVLDDEPQVAAFVSNALTANAFGARQFADPVALFVDTKIVCPQLIVLDLALGQSDAVEVVRYLEVMKYRGKVLLMSGHDHSLLAEIEQIGRSHGLDVLPSLHKPF